MKLIDELIERHSEVEQRIDARNAQVHEHFQAIEALVKTRVDLDRAIAALNAFRNEDDLDIGYDDDPKPERAYVVEDDAVPAEIISDLTGDPAVEPESGLHEGPVHTDLPETIAYFVNAQGGSVEMRDDGSVVPLTQPEWNEPLTGEGYAPVVDQPATDPAADEAARALAYYSPEEQRARAAPWPGLGNLFGNKPKEPA